MFKHILVPVDGSGTAMLAVNEAISLARAFESTITLVNVIDYYPFVGIGADYAFGQTEYMEAATASANQALDAATAAVRGAGMECAHKVVEGEVVHEGILETANACGADLIIMGSHGRHGIEKLLLGSVVQRVLSHTRVPVLVMRG
jgi:nucleotide-binding universal stress UspA family protein